MKTDFDFPSPYMIGSVVFRPDFNAQADVINATQAWSLFFTAGQDDKVFGFGGEAGRFFTNAVLAIGAVGILWALLFAHGM